MYEFKRSTNGFAYTFEKSLAAHEQIIIKMPPVSPNKRGINDIGWVSNGTVALYGTISADPENTTLWQQIIDRDEVNKTVTALKAVNNGNSGCSIIIKAILN